MKKWIDPHKLNWIVLLGIVILSIVLGVLNNRFRVYEEQRVSWLGDEFTEEVE